MMPGKRRFDMLFPVDNEARQMKELNGIWKFKRDNYYKQGFEEKWFEKPLEDVIDMPVPSSYNDITTDQELRDHVGWVWYERKFAVPRLWKDQRLVLRFGSVTHHAVIYLNGKEITRHKGGFLPFEADVTEMANEGENRLTVAVGNILEWDEALNVRDCELLKWIGANSFRTSHYPYAEEMMQMADQKGIVVIDEVPAVGMNFFDGENGGIFTEDKVNEKTLAYHKQVLKELYQRDKNHPCVVMWSITNEPHSSEEASRNYFEEVTKYIRKLDSERPITGTMNVDVEEDKISQFFDVVCINRYFGWYVGAGKIERIYPSLKTDLIKWHEKYGKPVIVTEYGADTIAGLHKLPEVIFSEEYQKRCIEENNKAMDECDFVIGEHIWAFADFMTAFGLKRVDGNKKGIFTRERQPKTAAFAIRERWRKML